MGPESPRKCRSRTAFHTVPIAYNTYFDPPLVKELGYTHRFSLNNNKSCLFFFPFQKGPVFNYLHFCAGTSGWRHSAPYELLIIRFLLINTKFNLLWLQTLIVADLPATPASGYVSQFQNTPVPSCQEKGEMKHYAGFMVNLINANAQLGSFGPIMLSNKATGDKHFLTVCFLCPFKEKSFQQETKQGMD